MKIKYLGRVCFMITSEVETKIITDPYVAGDGVNYGEIKESADIVTVSHGHADHSNTMVVVGNPTAVRDTAGVNGIESKRVLRSIMTKLMGGKGVVIPYSVLRWMGSESVTSVTWVTSLMINRSLT